tara:strand:- start:428 stop:1120 length:693 start_codon:yes stop_codon:yes gene_type:complete
MTKLLSKTIKTEKTEKEYPDWINVLTYLYPNKNLCKFSDNCFITCLKTSGRLPMAKKAMIKRTKLLYQDKMTFINTLEIELRKAKKSANKKGKKLAYRFNGTSDRFDELKHLLDMKDQPFDQAYDYTKDFKRVLDYQGYKGYNLTFSYDGLNKLEAKFLLKNKIANVSVVMNTKKDQELPKTYYLNGVEYPVLDGDKHDLRFTENKGYIIGLRAKGKAIKNNGTFVQPTN